MLRLLRAASAAQARHQAALREAQEALQGMRRESSRLEADWVAAAEAAQHRHRGLLRRFALVLQAKIDKEKGRNGQR